MANRKIEDVINDVLKNETQKNALDFVAYLKENQIPIEVGENYWEIKYEDQCVCFIWIDGSNNQPGPWTIWSNQEPGSWATWGEVENNLEEADMQINVKIKEIAWDHVNVCADCGGCEIKGTRKNVLGKTFDNLCNSTMAFTNPDGEVLTCAKKMVEIRKNDILKAI